MSESFLSLVLLCEVHIQVQGVMIGKKGLILAERWERNILFFTYYSSTNRFRIILEELVG